MITINKINIDDVVKIARFGEELEFSQEYINRVNEGRSYVESFDKNQTLVYGVTTGLGDNYTEYIDEEERRFIQQNHIRSHATSLGEPLPNEAVRAIMVAMISQYGTGHTGISIDVVNQLKNLLNTGITPRVPKNGSVGYLCLEGHIALVLTGEGKAYYNGELMTGKKALESAGLLPIQLKSKEGLTLLSGTTSVTGLASLALYDAKNLTLSADISGAVSLAVLKGTLMAFDDRIMNARPHEDQKYTANNVKRILKNDGLIKKYKGHRLQDALSIRCIPQQHGSAKKLIKDAIKTVNIELNSACDNPLLFDTDGKIEAIMACNADSAYVGMALDSVAISLTSLCKMSERRVDRLVNRHVSELPPFLNHNPGLNNGLMIPQYSAAGILGQMKILAHPSTIDGVTTCANQEDYTANGYNAVLKGYEMCSLARYIVATEIFYNCQAYDFYIGVNKSPAVQKVYDLVRKEVPFVDDDCVMADFVEYIHDLIKDNKIVEAIEEVIGDLEF